MSARLRFTATVQGVKVSVAKGTYDNGAAYADVTFRIESPKKPATPRRHGWDYDRAILTAHSLQAKPEGKLSENDLDRLAEAQAVMRADAERYVEARAAYAREMQNVAPRLMAYAQIAGLVAVFGGQPVTITLEAQDLLPGLDVMMLPAPEHDDEGRYGDAGEDLEDEDRDDDDTDVADA